MKIKTLIKNIYLPYRIILILTLIFSYGFIKNAEAAAPTHDEPILSSESGIISSLEIEDITCLPQNTLDADGDSVKNIFNWKRNGISNALINTPFEGDVLNSLIDYSNNNTLTSNGATWNPTGGHDGTGSYDFFGINQNIELTDEISLSQFTISLWVNINEYTGSWAMPIGKKDTNEYYGWLSNPGEWRLRFSDTTTVELPVTDFIPTINEWELWTVTYNGYFTSFYLNGELMGSVDIIGKNFDIDSIGETFISDLYDFNGSIDDVLVINYPLTQSQINKIYNNETNIIDSTELEGGDSWVCQVTPNDSVENGLTKDSNSIFIDLPLNLPLAPLDLSSSAHNTLVELSWLPPVFNDSGNIKDYLIEYKESANVVWGTLTDGVSSKTKAVVRSLINGVDYDFRVSAINSNGTGIFSLIESVTPGHAVYLEALAENNSVLLQWTKDPFATDYIIDYKQSSDLIWSIISDGVSLSHGYTVSGLTNNVDYDFRVRPVRPGSIPSAIKTVTPTNIDTFNSVINQFITTGQSLSIGHGGAPGLSTRQPFKNLMLRNTLGRLLPLTEPATFSSPGVETKSSGFANMLSDRVEGFRSLVSLSGRGNRSYSELKKGTSYYDDAIDRINAGFDLVLEKKKSYKVQGITLVHGEKDETFLVSADTYSDYLVEWQEDYENDIKAITGQQGVIPLFTDQLASRSAVTPKPQVSLGQWYAARDNQDKIYLTTPKYIFDYSDTAHMNNYSYRRLGEYYAKVVEKVVVNGEPWLPLSPKEILRKGSVILAKFNVPVEPLVFDTLKVGAKINNGFEYYDDSSSASISSMILVDTDGNGLDDSVRIELSTDPVGVNQELRYAYSILIGTPGRFGTANFRGNLRDSDVTPSYYQDAHVPADMGNELNNWSITFAEDIAEDIEGPFVEINQELGFEDPSSSNAVFTATFSEAINLSSFNESDIDTSTSTAPGVFVDSITQVSPNNGTTFRIVISSTGNGNIIPTIPNGMIEDLLGNLNNSSTSVDNIISINAIFGKTSKKKGVRRRVLEDRIKKPSEEESLVEKNLEICSETKIITQNLRYLSQNDKYDSYTGGLVTEAKILQSYLNKSGFNAGLEDGIIGLLTQKAIRKMQNKFNLTSDGYVGPETRLFINNSSCSNNIPMDSSISALKCDVSYNKPLYIGQIGNNIKQLQSCVELLGYDIGGVDGHYGVNTYHGIMLYQKDKNLTYIDGIAGHETILSLISSNLN